MPGIKIMSAMLMVSLLLSVCCLLAFPVPLKAMPAREVAVREEGGAAPREEVPEELEEGWDDPENWRSAEISAAGTATYSDFTVHKANDGYTLRKGIDVSSHQGAIDWNRVAASGVEFAFIRAAYRGYGTAGNLRTDTYFAQNIAAAKAAGLKVGVYIYSQAITVEEGREEANYLLSIVSGIQMDLPLVFDFEYATDTAGNIIGRLTPSLGARASTDICHEFCRVVESAGYSSMVYANKSTLSNNLYASEFGRVWLAQYNSRATYNGSYEYWQCSDSGYVDGISGSADLDFWYDKSVPVAVEWVSVTASQQEVSPGTQVEFNIGSNVAQGQNGYYFDMYLWDSPSYAGGGEGQWFGVSGTKAVYTFSQCGLYFVKCRVHNTERDLSSDPVVITVQDGSHRVPTALSISDTALTMTKGETGQLSPVFSPGNVPEQWRGVTWYVSDPGVVTVDSDGTLTAVGAGSATVTCTSTYRPSLTARCQVTVREEIHTILRVQAMVDDDLSYSLEGYAAIDVYVNGQAVAVSAPGYQGVLQVGDSYEIRNIRPAPDVQYLDVASGSLAGTIQPGVNEVTLVFLTGPVSGWHYTDSLPVRLDPSRFDVEYQSHYETVSADSPGTEWTREEVAREEWQDTGSEYISYEDLTASEDRVLLSSVFYHFCGPNSGKEGNYEQSGVFVHYDAIDAGRVTATYLGDDNGHPHYYVYLNGEQLWCESGVTCDGSYGTHEQRCRAWYKMNTYQDRTKVTYYRYTRTSGWVTAPDVTARSISYRYRLKDSYYPEITSIELLSVTPEGYQMAIHVWDDTGISRVEIMSWKGSIYSSYVESITPEPGLKEGVVTTTVSVSDHGDVRDMWYHTSVTVYDLAGNGRVKEMPAVYVPRIVHVGQRSVLPAGLVEVGESAFEGDLACREVYLPEGLETIGARAFADCLRLLLVYMPDSVREIAPDAFADSEKVVFVCGSISAPAAEYARSNGIPYVTGE